MGTIRLLEIICWLASNSAVGGFLKIGENTFIGLNSTISDNLNIGRNNIIGAGTFISKNTEKDSDISESG